MIHDVLKSLYKGVRLSFENWRWTANISEKLKWEEDRNHKNTRKRAAIKVPGMRELSPPTSIFLKTHPAVTAQVSGAGREDLPTAYLR